jgi:hypothetical protein
MFFAKVTSPCWAGHQNDSLGKTRHGWTNPGKESVGKSLKICNKFIGVGSVENTGREIPRVAFV